MKDFLSNRTAGIVADNIQLPPKQLGSAGTPQRAVISPVLFNLVMIGVAERLQRVPEVRHTIYADDITLWVPGGSDRHLEESLQRAINEIETHLEGTGLKCSPNKSELPIIKPGRQVKTIDPNVTRPRDEINIYTSDSHSIPKVEKLRILGMFVDCHRQNEETIKRLESRLNNAIRLIRRVSNRNTGLRESNMLRLIQAFAISHLSYVAAFHNWTVVECAKINALIRKVYKAALGLPQNASTGLLELGVHTTPSKKLPRPEEHPRFFAWRKRQLETRSSVV